MRNFLRFIKLLYRLFWKESPWVQGAGYVAGPLAGYIVLQTQLPTEFQWTPDPQYFPLVSLGIFSIYLLVVTVIYGGKLRSERDFRQRESAFKYDNRGTLYNNSEPNLAFHVNTFKKLLVCVGEPVGDEVIRKTLVNAGNSSCEDFASRFSQIYDADVVQGLHGRVWAALSFREKLFEWAEYESRSGWGIFSASETDTGVDVSLTHLKGLFEGEGGLLFGYYLGGYCQRLLTEIVKTHTRGSSPGKYSDYRAVLLESVTSRSADTVVLRYKWT